MTIDDFTRNVENMTPVMYRICCLQLKRAADREDAVQEAIFRAWKKRDSLREERFFNTWLIRILINICHDIQKRNKRVYAEEYLPEPKSTGDPMLRDLRGALMELDEKLRLPVVLHYIDGYSVREVSGMLNISENAVKLRLMRGRKKLKEQLTEEVFGE